MQRLSASTSSSRAGSRRLRFRSPRWPRSAAPAAAVLLSLAFPSGEAAAPGPVEPARLRYDLRAGDRLVYRERLERRSRGQDAESAIEAIWTTRVLVLGGSPAGFVVGFQRRRASAELLRASGWTKEDRAAFQERLARRAVVTAEANVFDDRGRRLDPLRVDREWTSELLPTLQEIEGLPEAPASAGAEWKGSGPLGLTFHAEAWEEMAGETCLRARGRSTDGRVSVRLWFSPAAGALARIELEGRYAIVGQEIQERLTFELTERHRDETLDSWLGSPDERQAALEGLLMTDSLPVAFPRVEALLRDEDAGVRRRALTLLWQRRRAPPPRDVLAPLLADEDPRVRDLAVRMRDQAPRPPARDAGPLAPIVAAIRRGAEPPEWRCQGDPGWAERALLEQRAASLPPGATLRAMTAGEFRGRPYVLRIPEDYRGDEPFPLLIHLAGGPGHALLGWNSAADAFLRTGYIVVSPDAVDTWWSAASERVFVALLDEVLTSLNVDPNRVFLTGFSNGGTGAFRFATLWPDRLAAAASLEGGGIFAHDGKPPLPGGAGKLPLLFVHGDRDQVLSPRLTIDTVVELERAIHGAAVETRILKGRGHDVVLGRDEGLTLAFFAGRRRDPFPRDLVFELDDLRAPRRYWAEVLEKRGGHARVEGHIAEDGRIELRTRNVTRLRLLLRRELLPLDKPVRVVLDGREVASSPVSEDCALLQRSWRETRDPFRAHSAEIVVVPGR